MPVGCMSQPTLPNFQRAKPFVKWVGGKRSLLPELLRRVPAQFKNYYEPFVGGGALFYTLNNKGIIDIGGGQAFLSDVNFDLIITYQVIQRDPEPLIAKLREYAAKHNKGYYYHIRSQHQLDDRVEIAARFIYLNKTCFNGLWRVNSKGEFNVPIGSYENPAICQPEDLRACHVSLQAVEITLCDFCDIAPCTDDFVYFDPPYHTQTSSGFTKYAQDDFGEGEHKALRDLCRCLHERGVFFMLSNSDTPLVRALYADAPFRIEVMQAPRMVNRNPTGRGAINELLIRNYGKETDGE
ncbi:MAG: DNA adenine methylase [Chloroflexi bacterium]|nr:DNA adenine methylase [Chloroflexota bacterium]MYD39029.1 DNA adenine methylase [Chloroflexota bacterium]